MKKTAFMALLLTGLLGISSLVLGQGGPAGSPSMDINQLPRQELSEKEKEGLILMREEEKLARDVYQALYKKWNLRIFSNISRSEQQHTSRVKDLLDKYNLEDPVASLDPGEFKNPEFNKLYTQLVDQGSKSLVAALKVGATVEDLDIKDLEELIAETDNEDIRLVYENLQKGSRNHMRSFYRQLTRNKADYRAQYISQAELEKIINSDMERGGQ